MLDATIIRRISPKVEVRLLQWMLLLGSFGTIGIALTGHMRFAAGFLTGAGIAVLGFTWLERVVVCALDAAAGCAPRVPKGLVLKLILRYPIAFGILYIFYRTGWLPIWAVVGGLSVPLAGGVLEGLFQVGGMLFFPHARRGQSTG